VALCDDRRDRLIEHLVASRPRCAPGRSGWPWASASVFCSRPRPAARFRSRITAWSARSRKRDCRRRMVDLLRRIMNYYRNRAPRRSQRASPCRAIAFCDLRCMLPPVSLVLHKRDCGLESRDRMRPSRITVSRFAGISSRAWLVVRKSPGWKRPVRRTLFLQAEDHRIVAPHTRAAYSLRQSRHRPESRSALR